MNATVEGTDPVADLIAATRREAILDVAAWLQDVSERSLGESRASLRIAVRALLEGRGP